MGCLQRRWPPRALNPVPFLFGVFFFFFYSGQLIASTSERGITVLLEVVDHVGRSVHNQTLHFNKTSTVLFTVPAGLDVSDSATLQVGLVPLTDNHAPTPRQVFIKL